MLDIVKTVPFFSFTLFSANLSNSLPIPLFLCSSTTAIKSTHIKETTQKETDEIIERLNKYNDDELEIVEKESVVIIDDADNRGDIY